MKRFKINLTLFAVFFCLFGGNVFAGFSISMPSVSIPSVDIQQIGINQIGLTMITPSFSVQIPQIGNSFSINFETVGFVGSSVNIPNFIPSMISPNYLTGTLVGENANMASLNGLRFDDIYIANPEDQPGTKSVAELAQRDLARFGLSAPVQSPLEASLFPKKETVTVAEQASPLPTNAFCLDDYGTEG